MHSRLNGISNAKCRSPSLSGLNLDFDSGVPSYQMFPLRASPSGSERFHDTFPVKRIKSKNSPICTAAAAAETW